MISWSEVEANPALALDYANQQAGILNAQGGTGGTAGNPTLTMGQQYLANNPDVFEDATARAQAEGIAPGQAFQNRVDQIAREHFDAFGMNEGRSGFGYTAPAPGSFAPSPTDGMPFTPGPGSMPSSSGGNLSGLGAGMTQMPTFDTSAYESALNNFGGLLNNFGDFFGGIMSGAQNYMANPNFSPYAGYPNANYVNPFFNASPYFGAGGFGGFNSGSPFATPSRGSANTGHNMLWTT